MNHQWLDTLYWLLLYIRTMCLFKNPESTQRFYNPLQDIMSPDYAFTQPYKTWQMQQNTETWPSQSGGFVKNPILCCCIVLHSSTKVWVSYLQWRETVILQPTQTFSTTREQFGRNHTVVMVRYPHTFANTMYSFWKVGFSLKSVEKINMAHITPPLSHTPCLLSSH